MRKHMLVFMLVLILSPAALVLVAGQSLDVLKLLGPTWDHSTITVVIIPQPDAAWWNPTYVNSTLRAISEWNGALSFFAQNYSDFAYLSRLKMVSEVSNSTSQNFDVTISWIERFENESCNAGLTETTYYTSGTVVNSNVKLAAYDCRGNTLSEVDMQNVALQELGHTFALGHANKTGDVMYFAYVLGGPIKALSTLDVYGVATVFRWMAYSSEFNQANQGQQEFSVSLPSTIKYEFLPISEENLPPDSAKTFAIYVLETIQRPEVFISLLVAVSVIVVVALWFRKRGRANEVQKATD